MRVQPGPGSGAKVASVATVLAALLAGCIGGAPPAADPAPLDPAAGDPPPDAQAPAAEAPARAVYPLSWDGTTPVGAFACVTAVQGPCVGQSLPGDWQSPLPFEGQARRVVVNLTWEPVDDLVGPLVINVWAVAEDGSASSIAWVEGPTPLVLDVPEVDLAPGGGLGVTVWPGQRTTQPAAVYVDPFEQPFHLEAWVEAEAAAGGAAPAA